MPVLAETSFPAWGIVLAVAAVLAVWAVGVFNGLTRKRNGYRNAFAQIDVQLKRRYDLVPNLVETVKHTVFFVSDVMNSSTSSPSDGRLVHWLISLSRAFCTS